MLSLQKSGNGTDLQKDCSSMWSSGGVSSHTWRRPYSLKVTVLV